MIPKIWRLSENSGDDNLGLACTEQGLVLGRTALIEHRDGRFVVRERNELEHLLSRAYRTRLNLDRLMPGLETVAAALNATIKPWHESPRCIRVSPTCPIKPRATR
jgi:hypothetical protein